MRKLFFLIPALLLAFTVKAADQYPDPAVDNSLATAVSAVADGETIYLDEGTYTNSAASDYTKIRSGKHITFKAIDGKNPVVQLKYPFQIREASTAKFEGIKFDGTSLAYDSYFLLYDATDNTWEFKDCEFTALSKYIISVAADKKAASIVFDSCYFHDITKSCILVENTGESNLTVTNTTFANIDASAVSAGVVDSRTATGVVTVDHCTFYNCKIKNTDYGTVRVASPNATVSNCIFAMPASTDNLRTVYVPDGLAAGTTVTHCLMYNYTKDSNIGIPSRTGLNKVECNAGNPLFNDLANNKYTYDGIYGVSMSPARGAATDGSDLGDPRWYTDVTYPTTNFAAPGYYCTADDATLSTGVYGLSLYTESTPHYIICNEATYNALLAKWTLTATRSCKISVSLDLGPKVGTNKHIFEVKILDKDGNPVGTLAEDPADPSGSTENNQEYEQVKTYDGYIVIPAEGNYTIELRSIRGHGKGSIKNIILKYEGEAPITDFATPYYCTADDATMSGTLSADNFYLYTESTPHYIAWKDAYPYDASLASWSLKATRACNVAVSLDLGPEILSNKHIFEVTILDKDGNPVGSLAEDPVDPAGITENNTEANQVKTFAGSITIPAVGDYTVELRNIRGYGKGSIKNIILSYAGGAVNEIPGTIKLADVILNAEASRDEDGIHFNGLTTASAKWNIKAEEGLYTFTAICTSTNWSNLKIDVLDTDENELFSYAPPYTYNQADKEISSPSWFLSAGNYIVRLSNPASSSNGYVKSFSAGKATDVLVIDEMANDNSAIHAANGQSKQIVLKRTFKGGMYNTLCVPFTEWSSSDLTKIFGDGYELLVMESATLNGNELTLNFDADSQLRHGRPYLVKPTKDVENPVFAARTIDESTGYNTKEGADANFIGSFIAGEVPAGEQNLFLGPNNLLYFSQTATPIKGMRAYFHVKVPGAANVIKHARIVTGTQVITAIDLVEENTNTIKTIENGQLVIIRDGIRYNVMGNKIQ